MINLTEFNNLHLELLPRGYSVTRTDIVRTDVSEDIRYMCEQHQIVVYENDTRLFDVVCNYMSDGGEVGLLEYLGSDLDGEPVGRLTCNDVLNIVFGEVR